MKIIGLTGYAGSGKDAVGNILASRRGFRRVAFADAVREALLALDPLIPLQGSAGFSFSPLSLIVGSGGWEPAKTLPAVRQLLQRMGTEAGRDIHGKDCWIDRAFRDVAEVFDNSRSAGGVVITDVRFQNELDAIRRFAGIRHVNEATYQVCRPGVGPVNAHASEDIGTLKVDGVIDNNGTLDELERHVLELVDAL
jgi:hypothetical protein